MDIKIIISAPELVQAINNLAASFSPKAASNKSTCNDCGSFTADSVLTSVGKCGSENVQTANGFVPIDQAPNCIEFKQPVQVQPQVLVQPQIPVQQPQVQQQPVQMQPQPITPPPVVPTTAPTYTMEQLAVAATQLVDANRRQDLVNLLSSFGIPALTALPKEQYGNFATQLRAMGAKI